MRRTLALLLVCLAAVAGCSSDDGGGPAPVAPPTSVGRDVEVPAPLAQFLDGVAAPGGVAFRATYRVLRKLGGTESTIEVVADPPAWQVRLGDLVFVDGPKPATCRTSKQRCTGRVEERLLAESGVFSRFFSTSPAQALAADVQRASAGEPQFSEKTVAGVVLRCAAVPIGRVMPSTYCLTPEGVFGFVETPAVRYELTAYAPGPPGEPAGVPFEIGSGSAFLTAP